MTATIVVAAVVLFMVRVGRHHSSKALMASATAICIGALIAGVVLFTLRTTQPVLPDSVVSKNIAHAVRHMAAAAHDDRKILRVGSSHTAMGLDAVLIEQVLHERGVRAVVAQLSVGGMAVRALRTPSPPRRCFVLTCPQILVQM